MGKQQCGPSQRSKNCWGWEHGHRTLRKRIFVYGGNAASALVNAYSENAARVGFVARQSLISAMNPPGRVEFGLPPGVTASAERLVRQDAASSLTDELGKSAPDTDLVFWDLDDERFGVYEMEDGSYLTRSPLLARATIAGPSIRRHIEFGSTEHLTLWTSAADVFVRWLKDLGISSRTHAFRLHWAANDAAGGSVELAFGPASFQMNALFRPYFEHLDRLGISVIEEVHTLGSSHHPGGRSPLHLRDDSYHSALGQLSKVLQGPGAAPERGDTTSHWNWDSRHQAPVLRWKALEELDATAPGRTAHVIAPRRSEGEKFPARFLLQNTGSDTLLVISHGALPRAKYQTPRFEWLATLQDRPENLLFLADGALENHPELELAWFTGDAEDDLTKRFAHIVQTVSRQIGAKRILFVGGSGGGFASLALASLVPGSRALAFNPQTAIRKYWNKAVTAYQQALFPEWDSVRPLDGLGTRVSAVARVAQTSPRDYQVIYVQNDDDAFHMQNHLGPFASAVGMPAESAVSSSGNVQLIVDRFAEGHNMPYRRVLNPFVDRALSNWGSPLAGWDRDYYAHLLTGPEAS
ncbi:DUF6270 domain-containing protein [Arthrobacter sp. zg-Y1143]|uniref:DUF6270 domain-containing protein n=1 Tax=Arthrobacter sp. zg-Y1143 TaxID=3049065 RepID=UPI0024C38A6B|nr:DUF6270 domain-containing protein [Arthrobacter sp. zg-Y1143]MDK1329045.1 DUF6270 domain-containing protein [Arthrobacter sp. zg-Y1143]